VSSLATAGLLDYIELQPFTPWAITRIMDALTANVFSRVWSELSQLAVFVIGCLHDPANFQQTSSN